MKFRALKRGQSCFFTSFYRGLRHFCPFFAPFKQTIKPQVIACGLV
nr:MAG TPA: hypothetical protein [Caudoviricetes sp.]